MICPSNGKKIRTVVGILLCGLMVLAGCKDTKPTEPKSANTKPIESTSAIKKPGEHNVEVPKKKAPKQPVQGLRSVEEKEQATTADPNAYTDQTSSSRDYYLGRINYEKSFLPAISANNASESDDQKVTERAKFINSVFSRQPDLTSNPQRAWSKLRRTGLALTQSVSTEPNSHPSPLLQMSIGIANAQLGYRRAAQTSFEATVAGIVAEKYPAGLKVLALRKWFENQDGELSKERSIEWSIDYKESMLSWLSNDFDVQFADHRHALNDIRFFLRTLHQQNRLEQLEEFQQEFIQLTKLPKWIRYAARGYGFALEGEKLCHWKENKLTARDAPLAERNFRKAIGYLKTAHDINPLFPEPATDLMQISRYEPVGESMDHWFEQALKGQPDYLRAYRFRLASLFPNRGGSIQQMLDFSREHAIGAEFKSSTPLILLDCFYSIRDDVPQGSDGLEDALNDDKLRSQVFEIIKGFAGNKEIALSELNVLPKNYFLTLKAIFEIQDNEMDTADRTLARLKGGYDQKATRHMNIAGTTFNAFRSRPYALASEFGESAIELRTLLGQTLNDRNKNESGILDLTKQVLRENQNPIGSLYFKQAQTQVQLESEFRLGLEVKLPFDPDLILWRSNDIGQIQVDEDNSVIIDNLAGQAKCSLISIVQTPGSRTVSTSFEVLDGEQSNSANSSPGIGVVASSFGDSSKFVVGIGRRPQSDSTVSGQEISTSPQNLQGLLSFGGIDQEAGLYSFRFDLKPNINRLTVNTCPGYIEVFVNHEFVFRSTNPKFTNSQNAFEISQEASALGRGRVRVSDIRISKWSTTRPPLHLKAANVADYYAKEFLENPTDQWRCFWLAQAHHQAGELDEANAFYKKAIQLGIPKQLAGFYLGDILEQQNDRVGAMKWYNIAATKNELGSFRFFRGNQVAYCNPQQWASYRLAWNSLTSPDQDTRNSLIANELTDPIAPHKDAWLTQILLAQKLAIEGEFQQASKTARAVISQCSSEQEARVIEIVKCFDSQNYYVQAENSNPIYRTVVKPIPFFRDFTSRLSFQESKAFRKN